MLLNLWGRAKVRDLEDQYAAGQGDNPQKLADEIVAVSLESHVLSRFTAYVAIDTSEIVNAGGDQAKIVQPVEMPAGWEEATGTCWTSAPQAVFGLQASAAMFRSSPARLRRKNSASADSYLQEVRDAAIDFCSPSDDDDLALGDTEAGEIGLAAQSSNATDPARRSAAAVIELAIYEAMKCQATEARIEPLAGGMRVSYLYQGQWFSPHDLLPNVLLERILKELEKMASFDATTRAQPRQAKISHTVFGRAVELEISSQPGAFGPIFTIRFTSAPVGVTVAAAPPAPPKRGRFWA
jgi:hypothetical protein